MAHVNPSIESVAGKVPDLRAKFKEKYADNIRKGDYDERDLKRLDTEDGYARCFLRTLISKGDVEKALPIVDACFKFRKEQGIWDLKEEMFPKEIVEKKAMYYKGTSREGFPILYINTSANTASGEEATKWLKKYIAWTIEQHHLKNPEQMVVALLDMSQASSGNVSIDITKYILQCFATNFPCFLAYMINYQMPMLLSAFWTVISAFVNSDQKKKLVMSSKKDIANYIAPDNLWAHMK